MGVGAHMGDLIRNEHIKLLSNWCNSIATAFITVGILTPLALRFYGPDAGSPGRWAGGDLLLICFLIALYIHAIGQLLLEALRE